jgi:iron complex transport system permease protein
MNGVSDGREIGVRRRLLDICQDAAVIVLLPAGLATVMAVVLAVAGAAGGWAVTAAAGLCVLALALGWGDLLQLPHPQGTTVLVGGLGAGSLVAGTIVVEPGSTVSGPLALFAVVIAIGVLSSFAHEMLRQDGRPDVVESVTGTLSGQIVAVLASGWVLLISTPHGFAGIVVGAAAVAASRFGAALPIPLPSQALPWIGAGFGLVAALVSSMFVVGVDPLPAVGVGVAVGGVGMAIDRLFPLHETQFGLSVLARAAAPVAAAGTVAYAVLRIGLG